MILGTALFQGEQEMEQRWRESPINIRVAIGVQLNLFGYLI